MWTEMKDLKVLALGGVLGLVVWVIIYAVSIAPIWLLALIIFLIFSDLMDTMAQDGRVAESRGQGLLEFYKKEGG